MLGPSTDLLVIAKRCSISPTGLGLGWIEIAQFQEQQHAHGFPPVPQAARTQAWLIASLDARLPRIRSGHLLLALLTEPELSRLAFRRVPSCWPRSGSTNSSTISTR
ncbi:MAG: hypothetical protein MZV70_63310 [Desulfobacterales bacterium]|nr:hypothetical protein [Desulfobacterales bacterium]